MPIRTVPWDEISERHVRDLIDRESRESRTLDYKAELKLDDSGKLDLLEDVTAMANAAGGTIVYGAVEGEGEERGLIVGLNPMRFNPDATDLTIANLLRDNIEERIHHVLHRAVPIDGGYLYVIRVPPSPRAPHMVTKKSARDRFFVRANVSNEPMRMQQIREAVLRSDTAVERARLYIDARTEEARRQVTQEPPRLREGPSELLNSIALMHFVPLFQPTAGIDLADPAIVERIRSVQPYGAHHYGSLRWTLEGLYNQHSPDGVLRRSWALLDRDGALEFGERPCLYASQRYDSSVPTLDVFHLDSDVQNCIRQARELAEAGFFNTPFVVSLRFLFVRGAILTSHKSYSFQSEIRWPDQDLLIPSEVVTDWDESLLSAERRIAHTVWQAFGIPRCELYNRDGTRKDFG
jgi:hypothetical protein